jgi:hypothetical protein
MTMSYPNHCALPMDTAVGVNAVCQVKHTA